MDGRNGIGWTTATLLTILSMVIGAITTFYGTRDQSLSQVRAERDQGIAQLRMEQHEALSRYVTREDWAIWKEQNRARTDQQYFDLLAAVQRIGARIGR